ncbi:MORN repeat family, partial [Micractinium conductrix]
MFDHFGVNSLSAFRRKFAAYPLRPGGGASTDGAAAAGCGPASSTRAAAASSVPASRSRWGVQEQGGETYVGELLDGRRHGSGILLCQGPRSRMLHVGRFSEGKRNGPGVVASSRGERFEGYFLDDVMWGPGRFTFAPPDGSNGGAGGDGGDAAAAKEDAACGGSTGAASASSAADTPVQPHRTLFTGMMNGRPHGKGCMAWSDGSQQFGQFDGCNCYLRQKEAEVAGVLLVASDNAADATSEAAAVQQAARRQAPAIAQAAQQLFAAVSVSQQ